MNPKPWIPVEDGLPEEGQSVLTYWASRNRVRQQTYWAKYGPTEDRWWIGGFNNHLVESGEITHWQALPDPPDDIIWLDKEITK